MQLEEHHSYLLSSFLALWKGEGEGGVEFKIALRYLWKAPELEISLLVLYLIWICFLNLFSFFSSTFRKKRFILANFSFLLPHYFVSSTFSLFDYAPFLFLVVFNIKTQLSIHCVSSLFMSLQSHYCCSKKICFYDDLQSNHYYLSFFVLLS